MQLHGFADASEAAAVVYLRSDDSVGVQTALVMAKTKVAVTK